MKVRSKGIFKRTPGKATAEALVAAVLRDRLPELEEKYRTILDLTSSGIILIDPRTHRIVDVNRTAAGWFGESRGDMIGRVCSKYVCPADRGQCPVIDPGTTLDKAESVFLRKDGTTIPVIRTAVQVNLGDRDLLVETFSETSYIKELQRRLQDSQAKHRAFLDEIEEAYYEIDSKGNLTFVNEAAARMYGYPIEELLGMNYKKFTPRERWSTIVADYVRVFVSGIPQKRRFAVGVKKDGTVNYREDSIFPIRNDDGEIIGLRGISHDITERQQNEEKLRKAQELYNLMSEHTTDVVWLMDRNLKTIYQSPSGNKMRGFTLEEVTEIPLEKQLTPESLKKAVEAITGELPSMEADPDYNPVITLELEFYRKDGSTVWTESKFSIIRDAGGSIVSLVGEARDISERKKAEDALQKSEQMYRLLAEHMTDMVWMMDLDLKPVWMSQSCERASGYTLDELMVMPTEKQWSPQSLAKSAYLLTKWKNIEQERRTPDPKGRISTELEFICKNGYVALMECTFQFIRDENGRATGILAEGRDITARRAAELARDQSERTYRLLAEHMSDVVWLMDLNLNVTWLSQSSERVRGYTLEETMALPLEKQMTPDSLGKALHLIGKWAQIEMEGRTPEPSGSILTEVEFTCKDGGTVLLDCTFQFIRDENGKATGILAEGRDITARRAAEAARDEIAKNYRVLAENTSDVVTIMDMDLNITWISSSCEKLVGYTTEEQKSLPISRQMTQESMERALTEFAAELEIERLGMGAPDRHHDIELEIINKEGHTLWTENTLHFIRNSEGKAVGVLMQGRDITERKRAEMALQQAFEDLKSTNAELQRRNMQLSKVREIALGTDKSKTTDDVLSMVVEKAGELPGVSFVAALKFNETRDRLISLYNSGTRDIKELTSQSALGFNLANYVKKISSDGKMKFPISEFRTAREIAESASPVIKARLFQVMGDGWPEPVCDSLQRSMGITSSVFVPVILDDVKWGALAFILDGEVPLDILEMIGVHCANALKNIIAYEAFFNAFAANPTPSAITSFSNGKFIEVNESFLRLIDCRREDVLGHTARELQLWPNEDEGARIAPLLRKEHRVNDAEITYRNKSGQIRRGVFSAKIISINNQLCNLMTINDVTERRQMEDKIKWQRDQLAALEVSLRKAADEANSANQAKSEFLARMSHEIRTPLHGVIGILELLSEGKMEPQQQEYLSLARSSADSLLGVISDILDFSKIEAGKFDLESVEFDLESVVVASLNTVTIVAQKKGLEIMYHLSYEVPTVIWGDPNRLRQILLNLLGNSVKFTEKGEILVSVNKEAGESDGEVLHFSITDTGIGIPKEKQESIFDAFTQVDSSVERRRGGTGLGLAICSSLVQKMGGRIWVESDSGTGSTFHFTIKCQPAADAAHPKDVAGHLPAAGETKLTNANILLIDDNMANRILVSSWLKGWGFEVTEAPDGRTGLEIFRNEDQKSLSRFSAVLLDRNMPADDGFTIAEQIRKTAAVKPVILMMLETPTIGSDLDRCRELAINNYVIKPISKRALYKSILGSLSRNTSPELEDPSASISSEASYKLNILVAEDNATSQLIAKKILEKKGHSVSVAGNGAEACRQVANNRFDIVFMDLEMPVLNGLEATQAIRDREKTLGGHIPIVAMTAYATKEDRYRCTFAGMDDYLVKPVKGKDIYATIDKLLRKGGIASGAGSKADGAAGNGAVDLETALDAVGGDRELLREAIDMFKKEDYPRQLKLLKEGVESLDSQKIQAAAHSIKGNARTLGGKALGEIAWRIEEKGRADDPDGARPLVDQLQEEFKHFSDFFSSAKIWVDI